MTTTTGLQCAAKSVDLPSADVAGSLNPVIEKWETALLMLVGFAGFSVLIGIGYNTMRRYVFGDFHKLDVVFDAGGRVSLSLTAVTVTSQMLWPADFLQSITMASKVGIGGSLWYTMAIVLSVLVFPVLCLQLKSRAPGAKTFPQIAYARFGKPVHIMFCAVALFTNLVISSNLILAGKAALEVMTKDTSDEFIILLLAVLFGSYCIVGGLGTTFYISYFNTALIFISTSIFILEVTYLADPEVEAVASTRNLYDALTCLKGPEGNYQESMLTFRTQSGLIYGVVTLFMTVSIVFCDQANWQSRIAAKPRQGIIGFLIAGFFWFAIPTSFSFVISLTYKSMSYKNGTNLLTDDQIDAGYISPFVIQALLGKKGSYLLLTMLTMTLMSTGSGEVMSVSSILVYDVFRTYIRPFRPNMLPTECPLCGEDKVPSGSDQTSVTCVCPSVLDCAQCREDVDNGRKQTKYDFNVTYKCQVHGKYRYYEDHLLAIKSWVMIIVIISIVPFAMLIIASGMNLNWAFLAAQVFIAPFLAPLYLTIAWANVTSKGLISGGVIGLLCAIAGMLGYGSTYEDGLSEFYRNTAEDYSILSGLLAGFIVSTVVTIGVSFCTKRKGATSVRVASSNDSPICVNGTVASVKNQCYINTPDQVDSVDIELESPAADSDRDDAYTVQDVEWLKTMSIDNPLNPYRAVYKEELDAIGAGNTLTTKHMEAIFRKTKFGSFTACGISLVIFLIVVPSVALTQEVLGYEQLNAWISVCQHWCLVGTFIVVLVPPIEEGLQIWKQYKENVKGVSKEEVEYF